MYKSLHTLCNIIAKNIINSTSVLDVDAAAPKAIPSAVNKTNVCHTIVYRFRHTTYSQKYFT
jgi:hypothetical protein